ncbi:MAG TPA: hypothetical protein VH393_04240 [Ktedonobacterales bacterium]
MPDGPDYEAIRKPKTGRCTAFPGAAKGAPIPEPIWHNAADHRKPYDGDHGIQFQPYDQKGVDYAALLFDQKDEDADVAG